VELAISSRWTPICKYVIPAALGALIVYGDHAVWIAHHSAIRNTLKGILSVEAWPLLVALSVAVMALVLWVAIPLKRVVLTSAGLRVSNYLMEIFVPLSEVSVVDHLGWSPPRRATIRFRIRTGFGHSVTVIPPLQMTFGSRVESEVLEKLRRAILFH